MTLQPRQKAAVSFAIPVDMLNFTNRDNQRMIEAGEFEIMVGASSSDIMLQGHGPKLSAKTECCIGTGEWKARHMVELLEMS